MKNTSSDATNVTVPRTFFACPLYGVGEYERISESFVSGMSKSDGGAFFATFMSEASPASSLTPRNSARRLKRLMAHPDISSSASTACVQGSGPPGTLATKRPSGVLRRSAVPDSVSPALCGATTDFTSTPRSVTRVLSIAPHPRSARRVRGGGGREASPILRMTSALIPGAKDRHAVLPRISTMSPCFNLSEPSRRELVSICVSPRK